MSMTATLPPLKGKYYGTEVEVETPEGSTQFSIWLSGGEPSDRQLSEWGFSREVWDTGNLGRQGSYEVTRHDYVCDGHWESEIAYQMAKRIADKLNAKEDDDTTNIPNCS